MNTILQDLLALIVEVYTTGKGTVTIPSQTLAFNTTIGVGGANYAADASLTLGATITVTKS